MQAIDASAIETLGIPRLLLMDHAGLAVARAVTTLLPQPVAPVLVCCGTGYNGGDGLAAARHLHAWGYGPQVVLAGAPERLREEPAVFSTLLARLGVPLVGYAEAARSGVFEAWLSGCGVIVDALLGIGLRGEVTEPVRTLIHRLNAAGRPIVAADIPSGLDGDTGLPRGIAVTATVTVAFGLPKQGCVRPDGSAYVGRLLVDPITLPPQCLTGPS